MKFYLVSAHKPTQFKGYVTWMAGDKLRQAQAEKELDDAIVWCADRFLDCQIVETKLSRTDYTYSKRSKSNVRKQVIEYRKTLMVEPAYKDDFDQFKAEWWNGYYSSDNLFVL